MPDGDELDDIEDVYVMPKADYLLTTSQAAEEAEWLGVRTVIDVSEANEDRWAREVGWYEADVDGGRPRSFPRLSDALRARDDYVVRRKGSETRRSDLNLPDEWTVSSGGVSVSDLKGVYWVGANRRCRSGLSHGGRMLSLGRYDLASDAALAYDEAARLLKGDGAKLNFAREHDHRRLRAREMNWAGSGAEFESVQAYMSSKVNYAVAKSREPASDDEEEW